MDYLSRDAAPFTDEFWEQIDKTVVKTAGNVLHGRRFIPLYGPLGIGVTSITVDDADKLEEVSKNGFMMTSGRKFLEIPTLYEDFLLSARDLESAAHAGYPADLSKAVNAAEDCALKEDRLVFFGNADFKIDGLFNVAGSNKIKKNDWTVGENAFTDIAAAINLLVEKGIYGAYSLAISPDLYLQMQRLQPGTGLLEIDRVKKLLDKRIYSTPVLGKGKAVLVCADSRNMDLVIGQDLKTAYLEQTELNHKFRILETMLLRIKRPQAIVIFE
ncbi:family 1 encapsulin nanocompartment shell protein [Pectinatus haikarae]|uniref:Type 1 encapsulin shell protein n=1 Tax=Pectinatus haikarae TaxID=349096 RepID=A0ABT9Y744_9FIRM|nr:family 1 encapsulin nanocompartment shell protein [Pectinatus haikarae]MDQ0203340.1 putative linocin/CFP29 family protein [Pectinatus haikarae]